jgi:hypothetical protein
LGQRPASLGNQPAASGNATADSGSGGNSARRDSAFASVQSQQLGEGGGEGAASQGEQQQQQEQVQEVHGSTGALPGDAKGSLAATPWAGLLEPGAHSSPLLPLTYSDGISLDCADELPASSGAAVAEGGWDFRAVFAQLLAASQVGRQGCARCGMVAGPVGALPWRRSPCHLPGCFLSDRRSLI